MKLRPFNGDWDRAQSPYSFNYKSKKFYKIL